MSAVGPPPPINEFAGNTIHKLGHTLVKINMYLHLLPIFAIILLLTSGTAMGGPPWLVPIAMILLVPVVLSLLLGFLLLWLVKKFNILGYIAVILIPINWATIAWKAYTAYTSGELEAMDSDLGQQAIEDASAKEEKKVEEVENPPEEAEQIEEAKKQAEEEEEEEEMVGAANPADQITDAQAAKYLNNRPDLQYAVAADPPARKLQRAKEHWRTYGNKDRNVLQGTPSSYGDNWPLAMTDAQARCYIKRHGDIAHLVQNDDPITQVLRAKDHWYHYGSKERRNNTCPA